MNARTTDRLDPRLESLLEHVDWARRLAGRLVADAARADDVVQTALAAAAKSPPRDATNLRGWLGEVVRNAARGAGREDARRVARERVVAKPEAQSSTDELVARAETTRDLAQHVLALDAIYREVVLLRWYEGLAPREIAKKLGVPVATVNTRLARAHGELRKRLDSKYGDRATWCAAFAPFAVLPKPAVPVGTAVVISLALVSAVVVGAVWLGDRDPYDRYYQDGHGVLWGVDDNGAATRVSDPFASDRSPDAVASRDSGDRTPAAVASTSAVAAAIGPGLHVEGRVIGFDGKGIAGLALRGRDPSLPRIEKGWLYVGNRSMTVDEREPWEWKNVPEALEHTLKHFGNPPGLREVLLGVDLGASTTTGADGSFAFDVPGTRASIDVADAGHVVVAAGRTPEIAGEVVLVAPTVRVAGTIVDTTGAPVAQARLLVQGAHAAIELLPFELEASAWESFDEVRSDEQGRFDLGTVATFPGARLSAVIDTQYVADVELPTRDVTDLVLVATIRPKPAKPRVRGTVVDERGAPVAGASVRMAGNVVLTDEHGRFDLEEENFHTDAELVALKKGLAPGWVAGLGPRLRKERLVEDVQIRLNGPELSITGRVVGATGRALSDWIVSLEGTVKYPSMEIPVEFAAAGWYGDTQQPETDRDGRFLVAGLAPQPYRLRLTDRETGVVFTSDPIEAGARDVEVRVPNGLLRASIRGRTVSELGAPVAGVEIGVMYTTSESRGSSSSMRAQSTRSDSDGEFELADVPRYGLKLSTSGKDIRHAILPVPDDVDPNDVVLTVTVERRFRLELARPGEADEFEILDARGERLAIVAKKTTSTSMDRRIGLDAGAFPVCTVSEEGVTIVLYAKDREIRRAPVTWTGERVQVLRP